MARDFSEMEFTTGGTFETPVQEDVRGTPTIGLFETPSGKRDIRVHRWVPMPDGTQHEVNVRDSMTPPEIWKYMVDSGAIDPAVIPPAGWRESLAPIDFTIGMGEMVLNGITALGPVVGAALYGAERSTVDEDYTQAFAKSLEATAQLSRDYPWLPINYQARTKGGKTVLKILDEWMEKLQTGDEFAEWVERRWPDSATASVTAKTLGDGWPLIAGLLIMGRGFKADAKQFVSQIRQNKVTEELARGLVDDVIEGGIHVKKHVQVPTDVNPAVTRTLKTPGFEIAGPTLDLSNVIHKASEVILAEARNPAEQRFLTQRLHRQVAELIQKGQFDGVTAIKKVKDRYSLNNEALAELYRAGMSDWGKLGNQASLLKKSLNKIAKEDPELAEVLGKMAQKADDAFDDGVPPEWADELVGEGLTSLNKLTNTWRMFLTSGGKTVVRNIGVTGFHVLIDAGEKTLAQSIYGLRRSAVERSWKPFGEEMSSIAAMMKGINVLHPFKRERLYKLLEESHNMYDEILFRGRADRLAGRAPTGFNRIKEAISPMNRAAELYGDMYFPKLSSVVHLGNTVQERAFMRTAFEMEARRLLKLAGDDFDTVVNGAKVPQAVWNRAWDHATRMTFSREAKHPAFRQFIRGFSHFPLVAQTAPFPRFAFANALPFVANYGPWSFLRFMSRKQMEFYSKNPRDFAIMTAKAAVGTHMLAEGLSAAWNMQPNQRWNEDRVVVGPDTSAENVSEIRDKVAKGFARAGVEPGEYFVEAAPLSPPAILRGVGQLLVEPRSVTTADRLQIITGLNRISGTGIGAFNVIAEGRRQGETASDAVVRALQGTFGNFLGGFAMPARTMRDILAGWEPEEAIYRDIRQNPMIGPFFNNVPWLNRELPPKFSPFYKGPRVNKYQRFSQLTGFNLKQKTAFEKEFEKLQLNRNSLWAATGNPEWDNTINMYRGEVTNDLDIATNILNSEDYKSKSPKEQELLWQGPQGILETIRLKALLNMATTEPKFTIMLLLQQRIPKAEKDLLKERYGVDLDETTKEATKYFSGEVEESPARSRL